MSEEEWGPWIDHDGKGCPVPVGTVVNVRYSVPTKKVPGCEEVMTAMGGGSWTYGDPFNQDTWSRRPPKILSAPIIRYRVKKPKGLTILEELLQNLDDKIKVDQPLEIQT